MSEFKSYRRSQIAELRPYVPGENLSPRVSISSTAYDAGSPKLGDMIARNPKNHDDQWLVAAQYFKDNFEPVINPEDPNYQLERGKAFMERFKHTFTTLKKAGY